jgi:hypothetical protein
MASYGLATKDLVELMVEQSELCQAMLSSFKKLGTSDFFFGRPTILSSEHYYLEKSRNLSILDVRQLRDVVVQMRREKNELDAKDHAIMKSIMDKNQSGALLTRDVRIAHDINESIWGQESLEGDLKETSSAIHQRIEAEQDQLGIHVHEGLTKKTDSLLQNLSRFRSTILCGPSLSGKSTILKVNFHSF